MGFQPVPDVVSVEFVYWNGKSYAENVLHYKKSTGWNLTIEREFALMCRTWWNDNIKPIFPSVMFLSKIIIKDLSEQNGPAIEYTDGLPLPGASNNTPAPMNVTLAVKLTTGLRGRSYRGRIYYVGLPKVNIVGDDVDPALVLDIKEAYEELLQVKAEPGDEGWCVVSRWSNLMPRAEGIATPIVGIEIDPVVDSQRRRLLGRGQ